MHQVKYEGQQNLLYTNQNFYSSQMNYPLYQQLVPVFIPLGEINQQEEQYQNYREQQVEPQPQTNIKSKISFLIN